MAMTWSEKLEAKGMPEMLLLQLAERFGPLPESARRQVEENRLVPAPDSDRQAGPDRPLPRRDGPRLNFPALSQPSASS
jgi:hypothetical protein